MEKLVVWGLRVSDLGCRVSDSRVEGFRVLGCVRLSCETYSLRAMLRLDATPIVEPGTVIHKSLVRRSNIC